MKEKKVLTNTIGKNRCKRALDENLAQEINAKKILGYCTEKKK